MSCSLVLRFFNVQKETTRARVYKC